jgi:uracil-DNA glycosylase
MLEVLPFDIPPSWARAIESEIEEPYLVHLRAFLEQQKWAGRRVYPPEDKVFEAMRLTSFEDVRVVIVGQDPYHGRGQAHGLCFSVLPGVAIPPSLVNIYKELEQDLHLTVPSHGCLTSWAKQGVLLLNATLTVEDGSPMSHHKKGWERFTDAIIEAIATKKEHVVFMLWGKNAQEKCQRVLDLLHSSHLVLTASHPSPFSAHSGFFGCRHFSKANAYLQKHELPPIEWQVSQQ